MKDVKSSQGTDIETKSHMKKSEQGNVDTYKSRTYWLAKKALGVATAALIFGGGATAVYLSRTEASSSALDLNGKKLTDQIPSSLVAPDQGAGFIGKNLMEPYVPEAHSKAPTVEKLWPNLYEQMVKGSGEKEQASKNLLQGEAQGIRIKKKRVKIGKTTPKEKTSQPAIETPSDKLEQGKSKEIEPLQLSKEDVSSLQSFAHSLEQNKAALRGFRKLLNDKMAVDGMRNLMQDEEFRKRALSELRDDKSAKQAISLLENIDTFQSIAHSLEQNKAALQGCRKLLNDKDAMEGMRNLMQDEEFRKHALSALKDEKSVEHAISLLENEVSNSTCTKWYKKYTHPGSVYYHECCKDEGNNFCEENAKKDKGRLAGYILGSFFGEGAIFWVSVCGCCCYATHCCSDDDSAEKVEKICESVFEPLILCIDMLTNQNPPVTPQHRNENEQSAILPQRRIVILNLCVLQTFLAFLRRPRENPNYEPRNDQSEGSQRNGRHVIFQENVKPIDRNSPDDSSGKDSPRSLPR